MTSDLANAPDGASVDRRLLATALTGRFVHLSKMHVGEFENVMRHALSSLPLRQLRGFKPLSEIVSGWGDMRLRMDDETVVETSGFDSRLSGASFTPKVHALHLGRGSYDCEQTWRDFESGEETQDSERARELEATLVRGRWTDLFLIRHSKSDYALNDMVAVTINFEKIPRQSAYRISRIQAKSLKVADFRAEFGERVFKTSLAIIWEIASILRQSAVQMGHEAENMARAAAEFEKFERLISE